MSTTVTLEELRSEMANDTLLYGPVPTYRPIRSGLPTSGISSAIREFYSRCLQSEPGVIETGSFIINAEPEVMAALKAVLLAGVSRIEERSKACRDVFVRAFNAMDPDVTYSVSTFLSTFDEDTDDPFVARIQEVLKEVLPNADKHT